MRPDDPPDDDATLVGSGSFRVDRARALEKLSAFRRRDVGAVMLLARCAAAVGATQLSLDDGGRTIEVRFDGTPFARAELVDPYAALFAEEGADSPRGRWLALALVHAWRPSLRRLTLDSGKGPERVRLTAEGLGGERVDHLGDGGGETVVRLELSSADEGHWRHPIPPEQIRCRPQSHLWGRLPVTVKRSGRVVSTAAPRPAGPGELVFDEGGVYGHLSIPPDGSATSSVDAYILGVYAGAVSWEDARAPLVGKVDDPLLPVDASLAAIVESGRRDALVELVRRRSDELVRKVAREQAQRLEDTGRILQGDASLRQVWVRRLDGPSVEAAVTEGWRARLAALFGGAGRVERAARVVQDACASAWMRELAVELPSRGAAAPMALRAVVDAAPVAFASDWRPVSYAELRAAAREKRLQLVREGERSTRDGVLAVWHDGLPAKFWGLFELA